MRVTSKTVLEHLKPSPSVTGHGRLSPGHAKRPRPPEGAQPRMGKRRSPGRAAAIRHAAHLDQRRTLPRKVCEAAGVDPRYGPRNAQEKAACLYVIRNGF